MKTHDTDSTMARSCVRGTPLLAALAALLGAQLLPPAMAAEPGGATVPAAPSCARAGATWTSDGPYDSRQYGTYILNNNNWGGTANQKMWASSESCWGVTTSATIEQGGVKSYPSVTRGWTQNGGLLERLSSPGTQDWTTKSGMGVAVGKLTKSKVRWSFTAPTTTGSRWLGLIDVYFHRSPTPTYHEFPPVVDLMIDQALMDQPLSGQPTIRSTYYAAVAQRNNAARVTLGGTHYILYIDDPGESAYHQPGGHTLHLFQLPTTWSDGIGPSWGAMSATRDLKAIIDYFRQPNPKDDAGKPILLARGAEVTGPLIPDSLYLNAISAGWEIDVGTAFSTTTFCVSMQDEADCR